MPQQKSPQRPLSRLQAQQRLQQERWWMVGPHSLQHSHQHHHKYSYRNSKQWQMPPWVTTNMMQLHLLDLSLLMLTPVGLIQRWSLPGRQ